MPNMPPKHQGSSGEDQRSHGSPSLSAADGSTSTCILVTTIDVLAQVYRLDLPSDNVHSSLLVQQSKYWKGPKKVDLSVANPTWDILFNVLCAPHWSHRIRIADTGTVFSMGPRMYNQHKAESNDVHRGNYMEGLVSLAMAQLGDMTSVLLSVILALRIQHENRLVLRNIRQNIAYCRQHNCELNILQDPAEDSDTFAKW
ncbi:hypothetical protein FOZ61_006721 [Perkinsus olseni]|uniref:Uncharacterized protein n=1 Tax=Perkinsus olseni TaxID=32597 RepID=A0A7J6LC92_PEROL|nr:hypothetical protein FOZ61_006721 [Perkinsus olseni]